MNGRMFDLGDVLSAITGKLLSPRGMQGLYDILNYMTGDRLFTHQLPRAADECRAPLLAQHPQLATIDVSVVTRENFRTWLEQQKAEFGEQLLVQPLPEHVHEFIDPMSELAEKVHPDKIIVVNTGEPRDE